jgi:glycolate oxidase iron-sulfur subunit
MCLQCRNCEAVCPSGVPYGRIMERARAGVLAGKPPLPWRLRALFLREVIARPGRMAALAALLRLYRASGARALAERLPLLRERALLAPTVSGRRYPRRAGVLASPEGAERGRVALLTGCIMPHAFGRVHEATVSVLARNGFAVVAPAGQACCGALHAHNGDLLTARALARRNVDAFLAEDVEAVAINSAGCGAAMKEYGELLADDAGYAAKAQRLSALVRDVSELLVELPLEAPTGRVEATVTYQDSCHLAHAQRVTAAPRRLLAAVPGLRLVEMARADRCCGAAGVYSLTQGEMSLALLDAKMRDVAATGAEVIATANPGCMSQLEAGLRRQRRRGRVVHVVELLAESYGAGSAR